ncbi:kinase-like domain-containing protein [Gloeopeniophorella convolvens]|nr:kinase-like domain-containing protein [Gloeopeniophorella convolvens]
MSPSLQLPSWADIASMSNDALLSLFQACEHEYPQPFFIKYTSVRRIASDVVMKVGNLDLLESEALAMSLVRESTSIPVPAVRRWFSYRGEGVIVMDFVPGQTLKDCWPSLSLWRRICVIWTIRRYIRQVRRVLVPGVSRSKQFPGRLGSEPKLCYGPMFSDDYGGGPFSSYDELSTWFTRKLDVNRSIRKTPGADVSFDSSLPLVFTHMDLHPTNIIIGPDSCVWLIDWEFSGFYPQWFEYMVMQEGWEVLGRWKLQILGFMAGFYQRQANIIGSISWAIHTGHFL